MNFAFFLNIKTCAKIKIILTIIVAFPNVNLGIINESVYGTAAIGVVPKDAFVINATPKAFKNNPIPKIKYLYTILFFTTFPRYSVI